MKKLLAGFALLFFSFPFALLFMSGSSAHGGELCNEESCAVSQDAHTLIELARTRIGLPYVYGGTNWDTGMDCSGFTQQVFSRIGITLPRTAHAQYVSGQKIKREEAMPGDLIYWGTGGGGNYEHVAIYIGNNTMIHSGSGGVAEIPVIEHLHGTGPQFFRVADFSEPTGNANTPEEAQAYARSLMSKHGWDDHEFQCLVELWNHESGWRWNASNGEGSGAYGIPQSLPGDKMASHGADWKTNGTVQVRWGLDYIQGRYQTPCGAWKFWQQQAAKSVDGIHGWY